VTSKFDLDLGEKSLGVGHDTSTYYGEHLRQVISKSLEKYGPDLKCDIQTNRAHFYIPLFL
jgi:hypothetical protein